MASGPITSWEIDRETVEAVSDFIFGGSKYGETEETVRDLILGGSQITADGDFSHEIKRRLLLGRTMNNLDRISKTSYMQMTPHLWQKVKEN